MFYKDSSGVYRVDAFDQYSWLLHGFGSRHSLDWLSSYRVADLEQIHSARSLTVDGLAGCAGAGDALLTRDPGQVVSVRTADCIPLLMVAPSCRAVAAVHAGWRGSAQDIAGAALARFDTEFGVKADEIEVAIGPGIGACCYEVGEDVADSFRHLLPELPGSGKVMLDLAEANRRLLIRAGVPEEKIHSGAPCTACRTDDFFSYRRAPEDGGRMVSAAGILTGAG